MALSLVCKDCGTLLRSVAEAQSHGEATGHSNFEESTVAVTTLVCKDCAKPCRSDAERDLHTRYTGHSTFEDKTGEVQVLDTAQQMAAASAAMKDDEDMGGAAPGSSDAGASGDGAGEEMVPAVVNAELLKELTEMGFSDVRATRAIHFSGAASIEAAISWLEEHDADVDIDEPLLVKKSDAKEKEHLTPEEARLRAEDLVRRAKQRREREEREDNLVREKARIQMGKELLLAKRKEEDLELKRNLEARKRAKEEEARAREKIRLKLEEDRKERRRKLGLPEELSEEEKAREAERLEQARKDAESKRHVYVKPVALIDNLRKQLVSIKKALPEAEVERFKVACNTLLKYIGNIVQNPAEPKFRTIKLTNAAFQTRVASLEGGVEFLELLGFERSGDLLTLPPQKVNVEALSTAGGELNNALTNPFFGML